MIIAPREGGKKMDDLISRQAAIDALWKALYEYEDKTEKQFQESDELDIGDWILHRIFVQNMSDIDRQTIRNLPSTQPEISRIEQELHGKTPEEQYEFLYWLLFKFGLRYTDSRLAVIEWLRGEK